MTERAKLRTKKLVEIEQKDLKDTAKKRKEE